MIGKTMNKWTLLVCCLLLLAGCIGRKSPEVTYYSLLTMEQLGEVQAIASHPELRLGVGPVTIPESLKRSQIATRQHGNQHAFDEFNRWAGVLEKDLTSVLGDNLGDLLGVEKVGHFPWMHYFKPTYRVVVDVVRLDGALDGEAVLSARWAVADSDGKEFLAGGKSDYRLPLQGSDYAALVKAESLLVAELSNKVAGEINDLLKGR
ncbi:PqiC family protein [Deltaproteobacteria bacterium IMCC39524]|nr:PqiC family protein [Deltaproteobacteria bacterium IMCC39524]